MNHVVGIRLTQDGYIGVCSCGWRAGVLYPSWMKQYVQRIVMRHYYEQVDNA